MALSRRGFFRTVAASLLALPLLRHFRPASAPRKAWIGHYWPRA